MTCGCNSTESDALECTLLPKAASLAFVMVHAYGIPLPSLASSSLGPLGSLGLCSRPSFLLTLFPSSQRANQFSGWNYLLSGIDSSLELELEREPFQRIDQVMNEGLHLIFPPL